MSAHIYKGSKMDINSKIHSVFQINRKEPFKSRLFTWILFLLALCIIVYSLINTDFNFEWNLILLLVLIVLSESMPVNLPKGGGRVTISFALFFVVLVLYDPFHGAFTISLGLLLSNWSQGQSVNIWAFNWAGSFVSHWAACQIWQYVRPDQLVGAIALPEHIFYLMIPGIALFLFNSILVSISICLAYSLSLKEIWMDNLRWTIPNVAVLWVLGVLMVVLHQSDAGVFGVLLFWLPLQAIRYSFKQYIDLKKAHFETVQTLAAALDAKDPLTRGHSEEVASLAVSIAQHMNMDSSDIEALHYAGLLHDIGKIAIKDSILNKCGDLTEEELNIIKSHSGIGADIVKPVTFLKGISEMIRHHHEWFNGQGYPNGLIGDEIPLGARILCVADAFNAMVSDRVYQKRKSYDEALQQLVSGMGTQFDPDVVKVFINKVLPELDRKNQ
jgi:putative nucleotidyltransferase with HDIG domain